jgi:peptidoglycan hydrolase CwlO-like protein
MSETPSISQAAETLLTTLQEQTISACLTQFQSDAFLQQIGLDARTQRIVQEALTTLPAADFEAEIRTQLETYDQMINFLQEVLQDHQQQIEETQATMGQLQTMLEQAQAKTKRLEKENIAFRTEISNNRTFLLERLTALQEEVDALASR